MTKVWRVRLGSHAKDDFARILTYSTNSFGPRQAEIYKQALLDALSALKEGPFVAGSRARNEISPDLRTLHVARRGHRSRHFLLYLARPGNLIDVVRILHDAMDLASHLPEDLT